jgi:hypothetical protein
LTSAYTKDLPAAVNDRSPDHSATVDGFPRDAFAEHLNATP